MTLRLIVNNPAIQEAQLHRELRESQVGALKLAVGLLDQVLASVDDSMTSVLIDLDEAILRVERARGALGG